jgi:adenine deaminase
MYREAQGSAIEIFFGVPSCVPATSFETAGAVLNSGDVNAIFEKYYTVALSEMMNFPGVIFDDDEVLRKIQIAKNFNKLIDGHAPGLSGDELKKYIKAGISTDHEAFSYDEAKEKILAGMKIQIREGSAARNFEALHPLIEEFPDQVMFCTDDAHPDTLMQGHIDIFVKKALKKGYNIFDVLKAASVNAIKHYQLPFGDLTENSRADFIKVNNLTELKVQQTIVNGNDIYADTVVTEDITSNNTVNNFRVQPISDYHVQVEDKGKKVNIIDAYDGELITGKIVEYLPNNNGKLLPNLEKDYLKIVVINRYQSEPVAQVGFVHGFGLKKGAIAGSVAHDSHNIIAVGANDEDIVKAVNAIIQNGGGIALNNKEEQEVLPLPIGGLMANDSVINMAKKYTSIDNKTKSLGSKLQSPFMTLAFMSLLVIPSLKLGDKGLFDVDKFQFVDLYE